MTSLPRQASVDEGASNRGGAGGAVFRRSPTLSRNLDRGEPALVILTRASTTGGLQEGPSGSRKNLVISTPQTPEAALGEDDRRLQQPLLARISAEEAFENKLQVRGELVRRRELLHDAPFSLLWHL